MTSLPAIYTDIAQLGQKLIFFNDFSIKMVAKVSYFHRGVIMIAFHFLCRESNFSPAPPLNRRVTCEFFSLNEISAELCKEFSLETNSDKAFLVVGSNFKTPRVGSALPQQYEKGE